MCSRGSAPTTRMGCGPRAATTSGIRTRRRTRSSWRRSVSVGLWVIAAYNGLISLKNQTVNAFKQIDVQLKRRHDLIPNLVNAVKGAMDFERSTLEAVIQ